MQEAINRENKRHSDKIQTYNENKKFPVDISSIWQGVEFPCCGLEEQNREQQSAICQIPQIKSISYEEYSYVVDNDRLSKISDTFDDEKAAVNMDAFVKHPHTSMSLKEVLPKFEVIVFYLRKKMEIATVGLDARSEMIVSIMRKSSSIKTEIAEWAIEAMDPSTFELYSVIIDEGNILHFLKESNNLVDHKGFEFILNFLLNRLQIKKFEDGLTKSLQVQDLSHLDKSSKDFDLEKEWVRDDFVISINSLKGIPRNFTTDDSGREKELWWKSTQREDNLTVKAAILDNHMKERIQPFITLEQRHNKGPLTASIKFSLESPQLAPLHKVFDDRVLHPKRIKAEKLQNVIPTYVTTSTNLTIFKSRVNSVVDHLKPSPVRVYDSADDKMQSLHQQVGFEFGQGRFRILDEVDYLQIDFKHKASAFGISMDSVKPNTPRAMAPYIFLSQDYCHVDLTRCRNASDIIHLLRDR